MGRYIVHRLLLLIPVLLGVTFITFSLIRIIPGVGGYDWATLIAAFLVVLAATSIVLLTGMPVEGMLKMALYRFLNWIIYGLIILMIFEAILSWVNPHAPVAPFVRALNEPLLRPLRRMIPLVGGLDLSMLVAIILLQILQILLGMVFGYR